MTTLYHNPRCSKYRSALALLKENGIEPEVVCHLESPPDAEVLKTITTMLIGSLRDIIRAGEALYRELGFADKGLSEDALIDVVAANPRLLERPNVVRNGKAAVGRPPENALSIL